MYGGESDVGRRGIRMVRADLEPGGTWTVEQQRPTDEFQHYNPNHPRWGGVDRAQGYNHQRHSDLYVKRVNMAIWYRLYVKGSGSVVLDQWYQAVDICNATTCSVVGPNLTSGDYIWWVQTYNSAGYGPWKSATFKVGQ